MLKKYVLTFILWKYTIKMSPRKAKWIDPQSHKLLIKKTRYIEHIIL